MNRFPFSFLISLLTLNTMAEAKPKARAQCDVRDELMTVVYDDPFFSRPENHKKRDLLIKKIATNKFLCGEKN